HSRLRRKGSALAGGATGRQLKTCVSSRLHGDAVAAGHLIGGMLQRQPRRYARPGIVIVPRGRDEVAVQGEAGLQWFQKKPAISLGSHANSSLSSPRVTTIPGWIGSN